MEKIDTLIKYTTKEINTYQLVYKYFTLKEKLIALCLFLYPLLIATLLLIIPNIIPLGIIFVDLLLFISNKGIFHWIVRENNTIIKKTIKSVYKSDETISELKYRFIIEKCNSLQITNFRLALDDIRNREFRWQGIIYACYILIGAYLADEVKDYFNNIQSLKIYPEINLIIKFIYIVLFLIIIVIIQKLKNSVNRSIQVALEDHTL